MPVIDYPNGSTSSAPIVLTDNSTQLQVLAGTATQSGGISESGGSYGLEKTGVGTLILTADGGYTGITTISGGTLKLAANGIIRAAIVNNAGLVIGGPGGGRTLGAVSGTGTLTVEAGSSIVLAENNSYSGITTILGDVHIGNGGNNGSLGSGAVVNDGSLTFEQKGTHTIGSVISGSGSLTQLYLGGDVSQIVLTAVNTYTGDTYVDGGTLIVDGSITNSHVYVRGGNLRGGGTVGTTVLQVGGSISGDADKTLHVNGDLTLQAGSGYYETVIDYDASDTVVSGAVSIAGDLSVSFVAGSFFPGTTHAILTSTGLLSGAFVRTGIGGLPLGEYIRMSYDDHHAYMTITDRVVSRDFDGSGISDFLWQNASGQAAEWLIDNGAPVSQAIVGTNPGADWKVIGASDFSGDGESDILWRNDDGRAAIWVMSGLTPLLQTVVGSNPGQDWRMVASGDFNADRKADILWQNASGQAAIWMMNGTSVSSTALVGSNPGSSWKMIGAGDFNVDRKADILWQNENGQAAIWLMNGATVTSSALVGQNPGPGWKVIGSGDFNGDSRADILWQNADGQAGVWLINGTSVLSQGTVGQNPGTDWKVMGSGDFNGDGKSDILWQNSSGQAAVWQMNGLTVTSQALAGSNPGSAWRIAAGTGMS